MLWENNYTMGNFDAERLKIVIEARKTVQNG
jgi:hypothetical protein